MCHHVLGIRTLHGRARGKVLDQFHRTPGHLADRGRGLTGRHGPTIGQSDLDAVVAVDERLALQQRLSRGCFAVAIRPVSGSRYATRRSPTTPAVLISNADIDSPSIDLTGYLTNSVTCAMTAWSQWIGGPPFSI